MGEINNDKKHLESFVENLSANELKKIINVASSKLKEINNPETRFRIRSAEELMEYCYKHTHDLSDLEIVLEINMRRENIKKFNVHYVQTHSRLFVVEVYQEKHISGIEDNRVDIVLIFVSDEDHSIPKNDSLIFCNELYGLF